MPENKVVAGALFMLARSGGNTLAEQNFQRVSLNLKQAELERAQALAEAMSQPDRMCTNILH